LTDIKPLPIALNYDIYFTNATPENICNVRLIIDRMKIGQYVNSLFREYLSIKISDAELPLSSLISFAESMEGMRISYNNFNFELKLTNQLTDKEKKTVEKKLKSAIMGRFFVHWI